MEDSSESFSGHDNNDAEEELGTNKLLVDNDWHILFKLWSSPRPNFTSHFFVCALFEHGLILNRVWEEVMNGRMAAGAKASLLLGD